jgi:hypothetical protein
MRILAALTLSMILVTTTLIQTGPIRAHEPVPFLTAHQSVTAATLLSCGGF